MSDAPSEVTLSNEHGEFPAFAFNVADAHAVAVIIPALGVPARGYFRLGRALADRGVSAVVVELRGMGASPVRPSRRDDFGYAELVHGEITAAMTHIAQHYPSATRHVIAHSLGGHLALLYAGHRIEPAPEVINLVAVGTPYWRAFDAASRVKIQLMSRALVPLSTRLTGRWPGDRFGFGGVQPAQLMREWATLARSGNLHARDGGQPFGFVDLPDTVQTRVVSMSRDTLAPIASTRDVLKRVGRDSEIGVVDELEDGSAPDHFSWLKQPAAVVAQLF